MLNRRYPTASSTVTPLASPHLPGVRLRGNGVDVGVVAAHAAKVEFCLIDADPAAPHRLKETRHVLHAPVNGLWHGHVPGVRAGQRYGFRVHGDWDPDAGMLHNPAKLLLDPYARAIDGDYRYTPSVFGHQVGDDCRPVPGPRRISTLDSIADVPHSVVVDDRFDGWTDARPSIPWHRSVIYEAHVKGLTRLMPGVPEELRGTYAGVAHPATIDHLKRLGVTTLELLPIHAIVAETHLSATGLSNYWGYNTLAFFAPHPGYATQRARELGPLAVLDEVKGMVSLLHDAGIEVVLDVVYNHTCESGADGPTLSWRGLDNTGYYMHDGMTPARLIDVTGCGNTLDFRRARVVQLALDSLRYWAQEVRVDGFRFDLGVTLGRTRTGFDRDHPFLTGLRADPALSGLKLIVEPWDLGPGGWRTGEFPPPMGEWNDRFRDAIRTFWLSEVRALSHGQRDGGVRDLATRLAGSADLFGGGDPAGSRGPTASVNFVTAHDGFTLADLTMYDHKHNEANLENNHDGTNDNRSWNHGVEGTIERGSSADAIRQLRTRSMRNMMATMLIAAGTPMITAGDEFGRTQGGNNNPYCQDNAISWINWDLAPWQENLLETVRYLIELRRTYPTLHPRYFYSGQAIDETGRPDLSWYRADANPMSSEHWHDHNQRTVQMLRPGLDGYDDILVVIHGALNPMEVTLAGTPEAPYGLLWSSEWTRPDLGRSEAELDGEIAVRAGQSVSVEPLTVLIYASRSDRD